MGTGTCNSCKWTILNQVSVVTRHGIFPTIAEAALYYGLPYNQVHKRINAGMDPEVAVGLIPKPIADLTSRNYEAPGRIYLIRNLINRKVYVGLTSRTIRERFRGHLRVLRNGCALSLYEDMRNYGVESFELKRLAKATVAELPDLERHFIEKYDSQNPKYGYNNVAGGNLGGTNLGHEVVCNGRVYHSRAYFCKRKHIKYASANKLFSLGLPPEDIVAECRRMHSEGQALSTSKALGTPITVKGTTYHSVREACRQLNVNHNNVTRRLLKGWTITDAFSKRKFTRSNSPFLQGNL